MRQAILGRRKLRVEYSDSAERRTQRTLWPLGVYFWGRTWTLAAWCESRRDFRQFRLDRVQRLEMLDERFEPTAGRTLEDFVEKMKGT